MSVSLLIDQRKIISFFFKKAACRNIVLVPCANYIIMTFRNLHLYSLLDILSEFKQRWHWQWNDHVVPFQIIACLAFLIFKFTRCFYVVAVSFCTRPTSQDGLFWAVAKTEQVSSRCVMTTTRLCSSAWREHRRRSLLQTLNGKGEGRERRKGRVGRQPALRPPPPLASASNITMTGVL